MAKNKVFIGYDYDNDKAAKDRLLEWVNKEFRLLFLRPVLRRRGGQRAAIGQDAVAVARLAHWARRTNRALASN